MENKKKLIGFLTVFVLTISIGLTAASTEYVEFNGEWSNGTVLYSDVFPVGDYSFVGSNVYPIRPVAKNCITKTECAAYNYHYETSCVKYNGDRCVLKMISRVIDGCKTYRTRNICTSPKIGCMNPITGTYTNQLSLKTYQYSVDGGTSWSIVPYGKTTIEDSSLQFKLEIPSVCSPEYYMNKAILLTK